MKPQFRNHNFWQLPLLAPSLDTLDRLSRGALFLSSNWETTAAANKTMMVAVPAEAAAEHPFSPLLRPPSSSSSFSVPAFLSRYLSTGGFPYQSVAQSATHCAIASAFPSYAGGAFVNLSVRIYLTRHGSKQPCIHIYTHTQHIYR